MTADSPSPTTDEVEEATAETLSDEELLRRIQAEMASRPTPPPAPRITIGELYNQFIALIAAGTGKNFGVRGPRVSEATALKTLELTLMWALNNRAETSNQIIPTEELGDAGEEPAEAPEPHETIEASADQSDVEETE